MESLPIPPITRFDAVMWFLRVYLWISVVYAITGILSSIFYLFTPFGFTGFGARAILPQLVPCLLLWLFPALLAANSLSHSARDAVQASDLKFLVGRCVGLALFIGSLGQVALYSVAIAYSLATGGRPVVSTPSYPLIMSIGPAVGPFLSFILGFALAFGPAIRDSLQPR